MSFAFHSLTNVEHYYESNMSDIQRRLSEKLHVKLSPKLLVYVRENIEHFIPSEVIQSSQILHKHCFCNKNAILKK